MFLKLPSLKLPAEVTIVAKDKEPPTAQDGFEIPLLSRICKSQERNPKRLFTDVFTTVLQFPCGSAKETTFFWLHQFYCLAKCFFSRIMYCSGVGLCFSQMLDSFEL